MKNASSGVLSPTQPLADPENVDTVSVLPIFPPKPEVIVGNQRLWQFWPGNNRFYFGGRIMVGPVGDLPWSIGTWTVLLAISLAYFVFVVPYLWSEISIALPLLSLLLFIITLLSMSLATFTEPGIIPRKCVFQLFSLHLPIQFTADILLADPKDGVRYRSCGTCNIFRPPTAHHCGKCGNCVEEFDHHCPFLNNCIGKRNYRYFVAFVGSAVVYGLASICGFLLFLFYETEKSKESSLVTDSSIFYLVIVLLIFSSFVTLFVTILCVFHIDLCIAGESTKDRLKGTEGKKGGRRWWKQHKSWFDRRMVMTVQQVRKAETWVCTEARS